MFIFWTVLNDLTHQSNKNCTRRRGFYYGHGAQCAKTACVWAWEWSAQTARPEALVPRLDARQASCLEGHEHVWEEGGGRLGVSGSLSNGPVTPAAATATVGMQSEPPPRVRGNPPPSISIRPPPRDNGSPPTPRGATNTTQQWQFQYTELKFFFGAFGRCDFLLISYCSWAK